jgi:hypothetical protein
MLARALPTRDWTIFLGVILTVLIGYFLSKNHKAVLYRRKNREIAEKAVAAGNRFRNAERVPVDANSVKGLRGAELQRLSEEFGQLGFTPVRDMRLRAVGETELSSFARQFVHRDLKCFAEIMATQKTLEDSGPLSCGMSSFLEGEWSIGCLSRAPFEVNYLWRIPKAIVEYLPGAGPGECVQRHLELRARVMSELSIAVLEDLSNEFYEAKVRERLERRRVALLNADILAELAEAKRVAAQGEWVWLGDYPQEVVRRAKGKKLRHLEEISPTYRIPQDDSIEQMRIQGKPATEEGENDGEFDQRPNPGGD